MLSSCFRPRLGAQILQPFIRNNIMSTQVILDTIQQYEVPYTVHISSSVVESQAGDNYTTTKKQQEQLVAQAESIAPS